MSNISVKYLNKTVTLLFLWSVTVLCSCRRDRQSEPIDRDRLMTQSSDSLISIESAKGGKMRRVYAVLLERYELAAEPYTEFRKGVDVATFDSTGRIEATLVADYAIQLEKQKLWEARGNVVVVNATHDTLETQQLFWNQRTKRIYSNVDSKVTLANGDVQIGTGFESDEEFRNWVFRGARGRIRVDVGAVDGEPEPADSTRSGSGEPGGM